MVSGDDDLFVNQAATENNVNVCVNEEAITYSKAKKTFKEWRIQKARHLAAAPLYSSASRARLTFNYFSNLFLLLFSAFVLFDEHAFGGFQSSLF